MSMVSGVSRLNRAASKNSFQKSSCGQFTSSITYKNRERLLGGVSNGTEAWEWIQTPPKRKTQATSGLCCCSVQAELPPRGILPDPGMRFRDDF